MGEYDCVILRLMQEYDIPGGAVAVVKDGRLVFAKGYGYADVDSYEQVQPDSLFRIASLSKAITAVATLKLVEDGLLELDTPVFDVLGRLEPSPGGSVNEWLSHITVRHLLQHSGGWDRNLSGDPMFRRVADRAAANLGVSRPATCETIARYMLGEPLDFDPGTQYAYSNLGYCILGLVIAEVSGQPYAEYVKQNILDPIGISGMTIGDTFLEDRLPGEVRYFGYPGQSSAASAFDDVAGRVPWPYGGFHLEAMAAHGGWVASPIDYLRFMTALDPSSGTTTLAPKSVEKLTARPEPPLWVGTSYYYGMGWSIRPVGDDANLWHNGSLPGTFALAVRTHLGLAWVAFFNSRPEDWRAFARELDTTLWRLSRGVSAWPTHDLFPQYAAGDGG